MVTTSSNSTMGSAARARKLPEAPAPVRRPRNVPLMLFGLLVVIGCALAFAVTSLHAGGRRPVLAVVGALPAGHVLSNADLMVVRVSAPLAVHLILSAEQSSVVGRTVAVPLAARSLLTREALGPAGFPAVDQAVIGVAIKACQFPPALAPGAQVQAYRSGTDPAQKTTDQAALPIGKAVVIGVDRTQGADEFVVELQLSRNDVPQVTAASAAGTVSLALISPGS